MILSIFKNISWQVVKFLNHNILITINGFVNSTTHSFSPTFVSFIYISSGHKSSFEISLWYPVPLILIDISE